MTRMKIESLGEFGLIQRLAKRLKVGPGVIRGVGDDCAVVEGPPMWYHLLTCDLLVDGVHFRVDRAKPEQIGWKALACSVSDIAAMGGLPQFALVALGVPRGCAVERLEKVYAGMQRMADTCGVSVVGGDTVLAPRLTLDVAVIGRVERTRLVLRSSAREGDHLMVTGSLGGAVTSGRHLTFTPRWAEARALGDRFPLHAMMDLSDGLAGDLRHLTAASRVGAVVQEAAIPVARHATVKAALTEGEDFELLFTAPASVSPALLEWAAGALRCGVTKIGEIVPAKQGVTLRRPDGQGIPLVLSGYRHF
ncbi:MAG: thiamine-monophosphate kinase [Candidatus Omnitrophica bacterium]|nr:thiamine-monophosphate kinase [Candidatus Omnitrophota bacterium]